jgi:formyltetrahydrofolate synthetase
MCEWLLAPAICKFSLHLLGTFANHSSYALAADIQTIPGLPTAPGYLNVDVDTETGDIDGLF